MSAASTVKSQDFVLVETVGMLTEFKSIFTKFWANNIFR